MRPVIKFNGVDILAKTVSLTYERNSALKAGDLPSTFVPLEQSFEVTLQTNPEPFVQLVSPRKMTIDVSSPAMMQLFSAGKYLMFATVRWRIYRRDAKRLRLHLREEKAS